MKYFRAILVGATLVTGASTWAAAQAVVPIQWGWGQRDNDDRAAFRDGYRQGRWDAENGRRANYGYTGRWRENDDRLAYRNGYIRGYREVNGAYRGSGPYDRDGDGDRDDGYRGSYGRGGFGNYAANARQFGYQDGFNDGQNDRRTRHSFRPTHDSNYKHADRGYDGRFGNKDYYRQAYRQAYSQGYQNGYNGGPWQRR
ncbi:MAG TPA: hypothetical protein VJN64_00635 [Terriglobales bacterium]|nr:hypothetical protein [Terriglobales bacterium]